ncbi:MAG: HlyD family secretion protein [Polyangiaceae bacterium]
MSAASPTTTPLDPAAAPAAPAAPDAKAAQASSRIRLLAFGLVIAAAIAGALFYFLTHRFIESTDDAQVEADIVGVPARAQGIVAQVLFTENQRVKAGDVLAIIDDNTATAKVAQAEAALEAAKATAEAAEADAEVAATNAGGNQAVAQASEQTAESSAATARDQIREAEASLKASEAAMKQAEIDRDRNKALVESGALSRAVLDQSETAFTVASASYEAAKARLATLRSSVSAARSRVAEAAAKVKQTSNVDQVVAQARARAKAARAQVGTAEAAVRLAKIELNNTRIVAPQDGTVSKKTVAVGQAVGLGQSVAQLVTDATWVTANFKEDQIARMRAHQPVKVEVDAYGGAEVDGEVESIAGATGSRFTLLPPDNASGNYTKVVQRVPVRIRVVKVPPNVELRPGLSVEASVDTRS